MSAVDIIIKKYIDFERKLQAVMISLCTEHCSACTSVCCREELCRETIEVPFLRLLRRENPPLTAYCSDSGWLTDSGCALPIGRAPVCYHFLCNDILEAQNSQIDRYVLEVLAALINHIGKNALGDRHLVEIMGMDDLERVKLPRFLKKLHEAKTAFIAVEAYLKTGCFNENSIPDLTVIFAHCPLERHPQK